MRAGGLPPYAGGVGSLGSVSASSVALRGLPLVQVTRGDAVESVHCIAASVVDVAGNTIYELGETTQAYPVRSLAKPLLAAELIRSGAADAFNLGPQDIALAAGSHDGEQIHVEGVDRFLAKIGLTAGALQCGPALEGNAKVGPPIANNCSGKHAAVLAIAKHLGASTVGYLSPEHPVQRWLQPRLAAAFGLPRPPATFMIDGCGLPIFATSLRTVAATYARFGASDDPACFRVRAAMACFPHYIGGTNGNLDTEIVSSALGSIIAKVGAEGLHADAVTSNGLGIAIKVIDGNSRALAPAVIALLLRFAKLQSPVERRLRTLGVATLRNSAGTLVGTVRAAPLP
jgi:L-asparaginase II